LPAERLIVFAKRPRPGEVKTRLAREIGALDAAVLYQAMAEHVLRATAPAGHGYARLVRYAPADAGDDIARWLPDEQRAPQGPGDLGRRMAHAFACAFAGGARRVVLIGTDAPALGREHVEQAFEALRDHDLAIGPACDGGYYLVGLAAPRPQLFEGIAWSTATVCADTMERARTLGLRHRLLPELRDVDTLADVRLEWPRLASLLEGREALRARLEPAS
jgi:rSAM/selenodomain-associated transferase 1